MQKKDLCSVWRRCCNWWNMSKVVCEVSCWRFLAGWCSMVIKTRWSWQWSNWGINWEQSMLYHMGIANILKISKSSVENHLYLLSYANHFDIWVSHKLSKKHLFDYTSICDSLLKHNENIPFLKQIVMGNDKWILYNNMEQKRSWGKQNKLLPITSKASLHLKMMMVYIW